MTNERCEHKKMSVSLTTAKLMESIDCPWCEIERLRCIPQSFDEWWAANPEPWNDARTLAALAWNAASRSAHEPLPPPVPGYRVFDEVSDVPADLYSKCTGEPHDCPYVFCHSQLKCAKEPTTSECTCKFQRTPTTLSVIVDSACPLHGGKRVNLYREKSGGSL